jgi:hypothetical protein
MHASIGMGAWARCVHLRIWNCDALLNRIIVNPGCWGAATRFQRQGPWLGTDWISGRVALAILLAESSLPIIKAVQERG